MITFDITSSHLSVDIMLVHFLNGFIRKNNGPILQMTPLIVTLQHLNKTELSEASARLSSCRHSNCPLSAANLFTQGT